MRGFYFLVAGRSASATAASRLFWHVLPSNMIVPKRAVSLRTNFRMKFANYTVNQFSMDEVNRLGPDLSCLKWLMNCGSTCVKMSDGAEITSQRQMREYIANIEDTHQPKRIMAPQTELVPKTDALRRSSMLTDIAYKQRWPNVAPVFIDEVDATDAALTDRGFRYFTECFQIKKMKLNFCDYFGDAALAELALGRPGRTLVDLEITMNPRITDTLTFWLVKMWKLKRLHLYFLPYVANREGVLRELRSSLPLCRVTFPESIHIGYGYEEADETRNSYDKKAARISAREVEKQTT